MSLHLQWAVSVAPRAGAWIETSYGKVLNVIGAVAPRAGAWIETCINSLKYTPTVCRPPCGGVD